MQQIRKSVFETNSSSSHSLTMGKGDLVASPFPASVLRQGVVALQVGEYGWEWYRYYSAQEKLNYLLTQVTDGHVETDIDELCDMNPNVAMMRKVVKEHTGCDLQVMPGSGYIDHQSARGDGGNGLELFDDEDKLKRFIFDSTSYIQTGNDNGSPPWNIRTDQGENLFYVHAMANVPTSYKPVDVTFRHPYQDLGLRTAAGAILSESMNKDLYEQVMAKGIVDQVTWEGRGYFHPLEHEDPRGYSAARVGGEDKGFKLSPNLKVIDRFVKSRDFEDRQQTMRMQVRLPAKLAAQVNALAPTPDLLDQLDQKRMQLNAFLGRGEKPEEMSDSLKEHLAKMEAEIAELSAKAVAEGLMPA